MDESLGTFTGQVLSAVIGGAVSLLVALIVVRATRRGNQDLARTQASLAAAENLAMIYFDVREAVVKDPPPAETPARINAVALAESADRYLRRYEDFRRQSVRHMAALQQLRLQEMILETRATLRGYAEGLGHGLTDGATASERLIQMHRQLVNYLIQAGAALGWYRGWHYDEGDEPAPPEWAPCLDELFPTEVYAQEHQPVIGQQRAAYQEKLERRRHSA